MIATDWANTIDMPGGQVAAITYIPAWWPMSTRLLIRRVRLNSEQFPAEHRARRRRTEPVEQLPRTA